VELLDREAAPFVDCTNVTLAQAREAGGSRGVLARALDRLQSAGARALGMFRPTPLYAVHGGLGGRTRSFSPFGAVDPGPLVFSSIAAGDHHACGIVVNGDAYCWGRNAFGQLGDGTTIDATKPRRVLSSAQFRWIGAAGEHTCAITSNDQALCWGGNIGGQLGDGTTTDRALPGPVAGGHSFATLDVAFALNCGVTTGGATYCWGAGGRANVDLGGLGAPAPSVCDGYYAQMWPCSPTPIQVTGGHTFASASAGIWHGCGLTAGGSAYCWGWNNFYNLGDGTFNDASSPVAVGGGLSFQSMATGAVHSCGLVAGGAAYCWGGRFFNWGLLGNGTLNPNPTPGLVTGGLAFRSIRPSKGNDIYSFTCGVTTSDQAYCWGTNFHGQLGAVTPGTCGTPGIDPPCSSVPLPVLGGLSFSDVSTGAEFACGITTTGEGYCWGWNLWGKLGNGTTTDASTPTPIVR
jgi:alpha-tubulin suppressor-like RCC1 family protein